ncbi:MAG: hypothetical protein PHE80_02580 [Candidatus Omnitrophica bacterium]|nr:hypothetical protein [Candidatus Omnitrophota bacterium]MDD5737140.1 hypothetical protein [Candidatus Omnitrophota bacterium]
MKKRKIRILHILGAIVLLISVYIGTMFFYTVRDFLKQDEIVGVYQPVVEKIYDFKDKHKEFPNSIDEYLKAIEPIDNKDVKIYEVRYKKNDANLELSIKCEYFGKKYEYLYQDPRNLTAEQQKNRVKNYVHDEWIILSEEPAK